MMLCCRSLRPTGYGGGGVWHSWSDTSASSWLWRSLPSAHNSAGRGTFSGRSWVAGCPSCGPRARRCALCSATRSRTPRQTPPRAPRRRSGPSQGSPAFQTGSGKDAASSLEKKDRFFFSKTNLGSDYLVNKRWPCPLLIRSEFHADLRSLTLSAKGRVM